MAEALTAVAAAVAASGNSDMTDENFSATSTLVSFLRMEADLAEEKARRLRQQAAALAQQFGVSPTAQEAYELDPSQMPPLDENGIPKYKGKKRGRKLKPRKRKHNPNRRKRQHTGYTLYMQENYPAIKEANPEMASRDIIAMLAKQWAEVSSSEKNHWKARAVATHGETDDGEVAAAAAAAAAVEEVDDDDDEADDDGDDDDEPAPPARRGRRSKK